MQQQTPFPAPSGVKPWQTGAVVYIENGAGSEIRITNYGGIVTSWIAPDKAGGKSNIVLGFDSLAGYLAKPPYFGATIGVTAIALVMPGLSWIRPPTHWLLITGRIICTAATKALTSRYGMQLLPLMVHHH
jgi:hypothetical protein